MVVVEIHGDRYWLGVDEPCKELFIGKLKDDDTNFEDVKQKKIEELIKEMFGDE